MKNYNVIPVRFIAGSGGNFLAAWIRSAKFNTPIDQSLFSYNGNAHWLLKDGHPAMFGQLDHLLTCAATTTPTDANPPPYYIPTHCSDLGELHQHFAQVISIAYDPINNGADIAALHYKKLIEDSYRNDPTTEWTTTVEQSLPQDLGLAAKIAEKIDPTVSALWSKFSGTEQDLCISFSELMTSDPEYLAAILAHFTGYNFSNWDRSALIMWRTLSQRAIDQAKEQLP